MQGGYKMFGLIRKSQIHAIIKNRIRKAEKILEKQLQKEHEKDIKKLMLEFAEERKGLQQIIHNKNKQHKRDLKARKLMNDNRIFFRIFREIAAPHILEMIKEFAKLLTELDKGEVADASAERKDLKIYKLHRGEVKDG